MKTLALAVLLITLPGGFFDARAQNRCGSHEAVTERLKTAHGERLVGSGTSINGRVAVELWASDRDRQTWTFVLVSPANGACMHFDGIAWEHVERPFPVERRLEIEPSLP